MVRRRTGRVLTALSVAMIMIGLGAAPAWAGGHDHGARVVAMGDSFASGEGTFSYRPDTDTATNRCHRSDLAYGAILARIAGSGRLVACSGAITRDLQKPNHLFPSEPAQVKALSRWTRLVTLGIGGNDLGFSDLLTACLLGARDPIGRCSTNPDILQGVEGALLALNGSVPTGGVIVPIPDLLSDIAKRAPRAEILVVGYPKLLGSDLTRYATDPTVPSGRSCALEPSGQAVLDSADAVWINGLTDRLNQVLENAADQAELAGAKVRYVPSDRAFAGHGLCDKKRPWINGLVITATGFGSESVHPTVRGQFAYLEAIVRALGQDVCGRSVSDRELTRLASRS